MQDPASKAHRAQASKITNTDPNQAIQQMQPGQTGQQVQAMLNRLQQVQQQISKDNYLLSDAKAKIHFWDVKPPGIEASSRMELSPDQQFRVTRRRSVFFKMLGKKKASR